MAKNDLIPRTDAQLLDFLKERLEEERSAEGLVGDNEASSGPPLPQRLRRLHERTELAQRLRDTADAVGSPLGREEADREAARLLSEQHDLPLAAFFETLDDFGREDG